MMLLRGCTSGAFGGGGATGALGSAGGGVSGPGGACAQSSPQNIRHAPLIIKILFICFMVCYLPALCPPRTQSSRAFPRLNRKVPVVSPSSSDSLGGSKGCFAALGIMGCSAPVASAILAQCSVSKNAAFFTQRKSDFRAISSLPRSSRHSLKSPGKNSWDPPLGKSPLLISARMSAPEQPASLLHSTGRSPPALP